MNYILECITCRKEGVRRAYLGETTRSSYQRGREHIKKILEGTATHPIVMHCLEEHGGEAQPVLMRALYSHLTAMDRQVQEYLNILQEARKQGQCLNLKSEWAGLKIPGLQVSLPKGVAREGGRQKEKPDGGSQKQNQEWKVGPVGQGGSKRIRQEIPAPTSAEPEPEPEQEKSSDVREEDEPREAKRTRTQKPQPPDN